MINPINKKNISSVTLLVLAGSAMAASLSDVDTASAVADYSGADFSGQSVTISSNNWGYKDIFVSADFSGAVFTLNQVNQPFLDANLANANFAGATFDWGLDGYLSMFRQGNANLTGGRYSYADFTDTVWNVELSRTSLRNNSFFNDGAGATSAAGAGNALNLSGADFNFSGSDTSLADDIAAILIANLGGLDGATEIGAFYDDDFVDNNYLAFGYASAVALETDLAAAGWQYLADGIAPSFTFYEIGSNATLTFDSATDRLSNSGGITDWGGGHLHINDGSNLAGIDFASLGISSWTTDTLGGSAITNWDSVNLTGQTLIATSDDFAYNDSMQGLDFSDATFTTSMDQPWRSVDLTDANFSETTFNITMSSSRANAFAGATLTRVDFSDTVWNYDTSGTLAATTLFDGGPGTTSASDQDDAVTFEGADLSAIVGDAKSAMITNLGGFDNGESIGAKYNQATLDASGWTSNELDAAGWQYIFDDSITNSNRLDQSGDVPLVFDQTATTDNIVFLMAAGAARNTGQHVKWYDSNQYPKHAWMEDFDDRGDWYEWEISLETAADYHVDALLTTGVVDEVFTLEVLETGETLEFTKADTGWRKHAAGVISLPAGTSTLRMLRKTAAANVMFKSLELMRLSDRPAYLQRVADFKVDTTWFSEAGYGLMFQTGAWGYPQAEDPALPRDEVVKKSLEQYTNDFDLTAFIDMVKGTGASYVIWSITWAEYLMCAPIASVDTYLGHSDNTATRDLIGEMATALEGEGIDFMLYYHRGEIDQVSWFQDLDYPHEEFSKRGTGDRSGFFDSWEVIITEIGNRYGTKLDGWFIDGGLVYYPAPYERFGAALRAGNPNRLVSWNPWYIARYTDFQDVSFGEGSIGGAGLGSAPEGGNGILTDGPNQGLLQHGMFEMENAWGVTNPNQAINTHISNEEGISIVEANAAINAPISFNMMMWEDGTVSADSLAVFDAIQGIEPDPDISTDETITFDSSVDTLTNTGGLTNWGTDGLKFVDGSDLTDLDIAGLGITSWTANTFGEDAETVWDGVSLSGVSLTITNHNFGYNDSMVRLDFSDATFTVATNQPWLFVDLTDADFSGTTFNITMFESNANAFRGAVLTRADFSNTIWNYDTSGTLNVIRLFEGAEPGATSAADKEAAVTFEGADLSAIVGDAKAAMIANLGEFDGAVEIGAKFDQAMLDASTGWTKAELETAGWQWVGDPEEPEGPPALPNFTGQIVRISLPGTSQVLSLAEVEVYANGENVALNKSATQSSDLNTTAVAAVAVDGYRSGDYSERSVTHTSREDQPWWEVDLGQVEDIDKIVIYNRTDAAPERLEGFTLEILAADRSVVFSQANNAQSEKMVFFRKDLGAIWLIGDSMSLGSADGDATTTPRSELYDQLVTNGYHFSFTGHANGNAEGLPLDDAYTYHSAVSGAKIADITSQLSTYLGQGRIATEKPDTICLMIGSYDIANGEIDGTETRLSALLDAIYALPGIGDPRIVLASIPPNRRIEAERTNTIIYNEVVQQVVATYRGEQGKNISFLDQYTPLNAAYDTTIGDDNFYPNATGNVTMGLEWFKGLEDALMTEHTDQEEGLFPGLVEDFKGYEKYAFRVDGVDVQVIAPETPAEGKPWLWRNIFWSAISRFHDNDLQLVAEGYHVVIVYGDVTGHPRGNPKVKAVYDYLTTEHEFSPTFSAAAMSRGGFQVFAYANEYPEQIESIFLDNACADVLSWPAGQPLAGHLEYAPEQFYSGQGSSVSFELYLEPYGLASLTDAVEYFRTQGSPIHMLAPLAAAGVPILSVCGDEDTAVPYEENDAILEERYTALGGSMAVIVEEKGHSHGTTENVDAVLDFIRLHTFRTGTPTDALYNRDATNVDASSATLNADLSLNQTDYDLYVYWGTTDGGTDTGAWDNSASLGTWQTGDATALTHDVDSLTSGQTYYFSFRANKDAENVWDDALNFVPTVVSAATYDIGDTQTVVFDATTETLSNVGNLSHWNASGDAALVIEDDSDFASFDFTALGITEWTPSADSSNRLFRIDFDGADLSGITIHANQSNYFFGSSMVGANFANATFNSDQNQPFLDVDISGADFSGATFNWNRSGVLNYFRWQSVDPSKFSNADFTNTVWNINLLSRNIDANTANNFFSNGSGASSAATAANALSMEGADFNISGDDIADVNYIAVDLITNLGGFDSTDTTTPIGAFYDDAFVANNWLAFGYGSDAALKSALDAVGWQYVAAPAPDVNGVPVSWLTGYGLDTTEAATLLDLDGDGMSAKEEYEAGTNPTNSSSVFEVSDMVIDGDQLDLTWKAVSGKSYQIWYSPDLSPDSWVSVETNISGAEPTTTRIIELNETTTGFFRVVVE